VRDHAFSTFRRLGCDGLGRSPAEQDEIDTHTAMWKPSRAGRSRHPKVRPPGRDPEGTRRDRRDLNDADRVMRTPRSCAAAFSERLRDPIALNLRLDSD
jgi:hypothetical protein